MRNGFSSLTPTQKSLLNRRGKKKKQCFSKYEKLPIIHQREASRNQELLASGRTSEFEAHFFKWKTSFFFFSPLPAHSNLCTV